VFVRFVGLDGKFELSFHNVYRWIFNANFSNIWGIYYIIWIKFSLL